MRSNHRLLASAAALAAFTLAAPATSWAQAAEIEIVGVVDTTSEPTCTLSDIAFIPDQTDNTSYTPNTSGPDGGRVDILTLADADGFQQQFRAGLRAQVDCNILWSAEISTNEDGLLNRETESDYVDYTAQVGVGTNTASFSTTGGTAGARDALVNLAASQTFVDVIIASLPDLPATPLADGTYVDVIFLTVGPAVAL